MRFHEHGLRAVALATLIALAGVSASIAPVAATDPVPAPTDSPAPSASPDPTPVVDPTAAPTAAPTDSPTQSPSPATADPTPTPTPTPDPSASADPAPVVDPSASPDPAATTDPAAPSPAPSVAPETVSAAATIVVRPNYRARIVRIAKAQRGKLYRRGAVGPRAFDCSGLVRYAYAKAHVGRKLGGGHSARGMYYWARLHHLTSRSHPRVGDVVVWGRGSHVGIYIGRGRVISALNPRLGIRITRLHALTAPFTTFIHTRL